MRLKLLEGLEGMDVGVGVVEAHHEAHRHEVVLVEVVEEGAAVGVSVGERQPTVCSMRPGECFSGSTRHSSLIPMP